MRSALTEKERIYFRSVVARLKSEGKKSFSYIHLRQELEAANKTPFEQLSNKEGKIKAAKNLKVNCLPKRGRKYFYVPSHFGVKVLRNRDGL